MSGALSTLRQQIADRLRADVYFEDVAVIVEDEGELLNELQRSLGAITETGGKSGLCAVVMSPRASIKNPNLSAVVLDPVVVAVHLEENTTINRDANIGTGKAACDAAERALALLHFWTPDGAATPLQGSEAAVLAVRPVIGDAAYAITLRGKANLSLSLAKAATPAADPGGGASPQTVELTCATAGAAIFYTLDGKFPSPTAGTLYTAPIAVNSAATLKAAAWLAGYITSEVLVCVYT